MKCGYCDSVLRKIPEDGCCPNCGALISPVCRRNLDIRFPAAPVGRYKDAAGYLEITEDSVTFYRKHFIKGYARTIPFRELYDISFDEGKAWSAGYLCVREWQDRQNPTIQDAAEAVFDATSVYFPLMQNTQFEQLYQYLKRCMAMVTAAQENTQPPDDAELYGQYDGFYGYMELRSDSIMFSKKLLLAAPTQRIIAYTDIAEVSFKEAREQYSGGLSVRGRNDGKNMRNALVNAVVDETSIDFSVSANKKMRRVYTFLMDQVRKNMGNA